MVPVMTNETEVLRIEGNVILPQGYTQKDFEVDFNTFLIEAGIILQWSGNIVPQDSPTGMRLYRVEDIEKKDKEIKALEEALLEERNTAIENDKAFLSLSEELAQER
jgi:hypothetical protein